MCAAYTKIETYHIQAHELCRIHAYNIRHVYSIYTAYVHTMLHAYHTHFIHIACMVHTQNLAQRHAHAIQLYEEMYAGCVQLFNMQHVDNCMYAAHNNCTHVAYMYSDVCDLMWHACSAEPILCMQHTCSMGVLCVQHARSVYAQYVHQGSRYM